MKTTKPNSSVPEFKFKAKKSKVIHSENVIFHPSFEVKTTGVFGKKAPISLVALMYSQENDILFI